MGDEQTLSKRVEEEAVKAYSRWEECKGGNHQSMCAAIGPLVAANMGLEDELREAREDGQSRAELVTVLDVRRREIDRLNGAIANLREVIAQASAAQTAGRDQASEIQRLKSERAHADAALTDATAKLEQLTRREQSLTEHAQTQDREIQRLAEEVSVARGETAFERSNVRDLKTTVRTLAGLLAARGQS